MQPSSPSTSSPQPIIISSPLRKKISLSDFTLISIIGKGAYGDVFLTHKLDHPSQLYALKQIQKRRLQKQHKQYQALVQKQLLRCLKHPGIIKLKYAFQDKHKLYFILEYCKNGEFIKFMKNNGEKFSQSVRRYYVAQIVNILEYLSEINVTHRDLKNLLLSKSGHLKLIDFGTAEISQASILSKQFREQIQKQKQKQQGEIQQQKKYPQQNINTLSQQKPQQSSCSLSHTSPLLPQQQQSSSPRKRRSTFVGTSYYISPQLLQQNICSPSSDLWALGCIIYQLYYLQTPFKDNTEYGVFEKIKKVDLEFPKNQIISDEAVDLIKKLLVKNPDQRLGSGETEELSFDKLKKHNYFQYINIDNIYQMVPPDIDVKKFIMETQEQLNQRLIEFQKNAKQHLDKLMKQQQYETQQKQQNKQIIIQGIVQHRYKYPYYQYVYLRIYSTNQAYILSSQNNKKSIQLFQILDCHLLYDNFINNNKNEQQSERIPQINLFKINQKKQLIKKDEEIKIKIKDENNEKNNLKKNYANKFWIKRQGTWNNPFVKEVFRVENAEEWVNKINQKQI